MARYADFALDYHWTFDQIFGTRYGYEPAEWLEVLKIARFEKGYKRGLSEAEVMKEMEKREAEMKEEAAKHQFEEQRKALLYNQTLPSLVDYDDDDYDYNDHDDDDD